MTDITLSRNEASATSLGLVQLLKDLFSATPLGLVLAALRTR